MTQTGGRENISQLAEYKDILTDQAILSHLQQAVIVFSDAGIILRIEGAFEPIFHAPREGYVGGPLSALVLRHYIDEIFERLNKGQSSVIVRDIPVSDMLSHLESLDISGVPLPEATAYMITFMPRKWAGQVTDQVTDLSGAAMTVKGLSAMLAHEIKNPLSGIKGAAQLLARKLPEKQLKLTDMMIKEVDRISRLVNDLENFTNPTLDDLQAINVHECLDQALDNLDAGLGQGFHFERLYDPSLPAISGHFDALVQIFLNIIKNAIEASYDGGRIKVRTRYQHSLWIRDDEGNRQKLPIEVLIEDEGKGVDPDIRNHLFDPFITNKEGGSGLGLAMVAQHMIAMGGIIRCEHNDPCGTRMHLYFQMAKE